MITSEDAQKIVIEVRRLEVLETRMVSQDEVVVEAEDVEVHVVVDEEEEVVEDVEEDVVDNSMWMKCPIRAWCSSQARDRPARRLWPRE